MSNREMMSLTELQARIKGAVEGAVPGRFWVRAETGEVKLNSSGHCYIDLIEKEGNKGVKAKMQAVVWASVFKMIRPYFETTTGSALSRGMNILVNVTVQYSALYGLSLSINDIDPSYTVGEQELLRQQTITRLRQEGMFGLNSSLEFPTLPRRLAVISSEGAAGYRDFCEHLAKNEYGFSFSIRLFHSPMQGEGAPAGMIAALDSVAEVSGEFDLVFIIRGGGAAQDLICFDNYELALNIAQFPLPVITGIGHDHDYHVADMVAHTNVKTPTAAAGMLIDLFIAEDQLIASYSQRLYMALKSRSESEDKRAERFLDKLRMALANKVQREEHRLELLEARLKAANPANSLEKGFSIVYHKGKRVVSSATVGAGEEISVMFADGRLLCNVKERMDNQ